MKGKLRFLLIVLLELVLILLAILFWGSIASALFAFLAIIVPCEVLIKRFLIDRESSDYDDYN